MNKLSPPWSAACALAVLLLVLTARLAKRAAAMWAEEGEALDAERAAADVLEVGPGGGWRPSRPVGAGQHRGPVCECFAVEGGACWCAAAAVPPPSRVCALTRGLGTR